MPPPANATQLLLSPAELSYLHTSLSQTPPLRPDGRTPTQFRPLIAETGLLPSTNGSARVCWSEGEECIAGVKCEVERTAISSGEAEGEGENAQQVTGDASWVSLSIEIPGLRDDDALPVFLASMLTEALVQSGFLARRLVINRLWHWRVYIDILLLSPPLSYPLPLLSMTTHLALLDTNLPRLVSEGNEDPMFDDDWDAAIPLYSSISLSGLGKAKGKSSATPAVEQHTENPPITLLTTTINNKILFDPSREEIAVADAVVAISLASSGSINKTSSATNPETQARTYTLLSIRTIDSPARLTPHGLADEDNPATNMNTNTANPTSVSTPTSAAKGSISATGNKTGIWSPPVGGMSRGLLGRIVSLCVGDESRGQTGVAGEVFDGLAGSARDAV